MIREIVVAVALLASGAARPQQYHGPKCIGSYCLDQEVPVGSILKRLGPTPRISPSASYCYRSPDGTLFLYVEGSGENPPTVDAVFISDFQNCFHARVLVSGDDLAKWATGEGIGIGTNVDNVRKKYGTPSKEGKLSINLLRVLLKGYQGGGEMKQFGDENLTYAADPQIGDLSDAEFGIRNGKVSYIMLSYRE